MKFKVLCEDRYGIGFLEDLILRMKNDNLIPRVPVSVTKFYGPCNPKTDSQVKAFAYMSNYDSFVVVADTDGNLQTEVRVKVSQHIPTELQDSTDLVLLDYEIEDWLLINEDIPWALVSKNSKPSAILRERIGYEKHRLRQYAQRLNIAKLRRQCRSFNEFIECFNRPRP
jgi:hypothetical protein